MDGNFSTMFRRAFCAIFFFNVCTAIKRHPLVQTIPSLLLDESSVSRRADGAVAPLMDVFQVSTPIAIPNGVPSQCQHVLMSYSFGNSYGKPFSGKSIVWHHCASPRVGFGGVTRHQVLIRLNRAISTSSM
jgi:hypothetical protein